MTRYIRTAVILFLISAICTALCAVVNEVTAPRIAENVEKERISALEDVASGLAIGEEVQVGDGTVNYYIPLSDGSATAGYIVELSSSGYGGAMTIIASYSTDGSVLAAVGTLGGEMCTVELWRMDRNGRTIPVDTPQEPGVREFFAKDAALPKDINPSVSICLGRGGLVARPIFWNASGMVHVPLTNDVSYQWDGRHFQKQVQPHQDTPANGF